MQGYWDDEDKTREVLDDDGWMHTGDLAVIDAEGYCDIVGRVKDMIIRGGENISPREIEESLQEHPAVAEAAVVGMPDPTFGENIWAVVALKPGAEATEDDIKAHVAKYVTKFKIPAKVCFVPMLPTNPTGKILKREIKKQLEPQAAESAKAT